MLPSTKPFPKTYLCTFNHNFFSTEFFNNTALIHFGDHDHVQRIFFADQLSFIKFRYISTRPSTLLKQVRRDFTHQVSVFFQSDLSIHFLIKHECNKCIYFPGKHRTTAVHFPQPNSVLHTDRTGIRKRYISMWTCLFSLFLFFKNEHNKSRTTYKRCNCCTGVLKNSWNWSLDKNSNVSIKNWFLVFHKISVSRHGPQQHFRQKFKT